LRDPQVAIADRVERGGRGGERAAPIAGQMMDAYFDLYGRP
jgi:cell division protein FtsI/penicillin-binding protein 2